jgi:hypothetical protein
MTALSFIAMFVLMYAMVDRFANVYPNLNQFYMAGLMAAPMVIIELLVMRAMYPDMKMNVIFGGVTSCWSRTKVRETTMAKLKLGAIADDKPVKLTIELPAAVHRDLIAYADYLNGQHVSVAFREGREWRI